MGFRATGKSNNSFRLLNVQAVAIFSGVRSIQKRLKTTAAEFTITADNISFGYKPIAYLKEDRPLEPQEPKIPSFL